MKVQRGYKCRLYPTKEQEKLFNINFNRSRFVYNHFLALRKQAYEEQNKTVNFFECSKLLTELKHTEGYEWLNESDSYCLVQSLRDLDAAYKNFFRRIKKHQPPYGFPKFHSKDGKQAYRTQNVNGKAMKYD